LKVIRLCSEEHQRPEGSEPLELPEEGSNPLFQNNSRRPSEEQHPQTFLEEDRQPPFPANRHLTATANQQPILSGCCFTLHDEELLNTGKSSGPLGPAAAALSGRFIGAGTRICQRPSSEKRHAAAVLWNDPQNTCFTGESTSVPEYLRALVQSQAVLPATSAIYNFDIFARARVDRAIERLPRVRSTG
jgi:hypothetical protein